MRWMRIFSAGISAMLLNAPNSPIWAASAIHIRGVVTETSSATVIENAQVSLKNFALETQTNSAGEYALDSILTVDSSKTDTMTESIFHRMQSRNESNFSSTSMHFADGAVQIAVPSSRGFYECRFDIAGRSLGMRTVPQKLKMSAKKSAKVASLSEENFCDTLVVEKEGFFSKRIVLTNSDTVLNIALDSIPQAKFLKQGAGSSSQTISQNAEIVPFSFKVENADSVIIENIPKGISAVFDSKNKTVNFSGKVTDKEGTYSYKLTAIGEYSKATREGKFIVTKEEKPVVKIDSARACIPDGYAMVDGVTTGGAGGDTVEVSTYKDFKDAVQAKEAKVVVVKGLIKTTDGDGYGLGIASNKTIMGKDSAATIYGGLAIKNASNIIIYNLNINGTYPNPGPSDGIAVANSHHIFISHLNIWNAEDGNLDITNRSSYVTVSYVKFWYTDKNHPHRLNALIGSGAADHPEDFGHLKVTYHHNWFSTLVNERMPRVMYGNAHIYNNYYNAPGNLYCIGVGSYGSALIENNYFKNVQNPIQFMYNIYAFILQRNNQFENTTGTQDGTATGKIYGERYITTDPYTLKEDPVKLTSVPYKYKLDDVKNVKNFVMKNAGPHKL